MRRTLIVALLLAASTAAAADYEMTTYYMALLHRGPKWTSEQTAEVKAIQQGHMENRSAEAVTIARLLQSQFRRREPCTDASFCSESH
jgi:hypothetical protein